MGKVTRFIVVALTAIVSLGVGGSALAAPPRADEKWTAQYWNNPTLSGSPVVERTESGIDHDWGQGSPGQGINSDNFSVRWQRTVNFSAGTYRFAMTTDDGARLWVDDRITIDQWYDHPARTFTNDVVLTAGEHRIRMEYYERGVDAVAKLSWAEIGSDPTAAWTGRYYSGTSFSGEPKLVRYDNSIQFDWGEGRPAEGVGLPTDQFSVRWTRDVFFEAGVYRFTATVDDGVRVWIDDQRIVDQWKDQPATSYSADRELSRGTHRIRVEYYENTGQAVAKFSWAAAATPPPPGDSWRAEYFNNTGLSGTPVLVRNETTLDYDWSIGSPGGNVQADLWSARWTRSTNFATGGTYRFTATSDDGIRVWVDNRLLIDRWYDHAAETYTADVALSVGTHTVKVEYYERTGQAVARLSWALLGSPSASGWRAQYYNNRTLAGSPVMARDEAAIDYNWGTGGPGGGVQANNWSARWTRTASFDPGTYRFSATSDDGIRVWVDDRLLIDRWSIHPAETYVADVKLVAGNHTIKVEYYEAEGLAVAKLTWRSTDGAPTSSGVTAVVNTGALNIRSGPGLSYTVIGRAFQGQTVDVLARSPLSQWAYVDYKGERGWMYAAYLKFSGDFYSLPVRR